MSELINKDDDRATIRWKLLTGASALALAAYGSAVAVAKAEDASRPQVWIELGGQLSRLEDSQETFTAPFETMRPSIFSASEKFERPPLYSIDESGKISFQPENSDWSFSASIRYGRSDSSRHVRQQTYPATGNFPSAFFVIRNPEPVAARFADTKSRNTEQSAIIDFSVGKDVGIGALGRTLESSTVSLGVRFAQFRDESNIALKSDPDWRFVMNTFTTYYGSGLKWPNQPYHSNAARLRADRSFHGVGPSLSWNASVPFAGNAQDGELTLDWGVNAAMLFGRQKTRTQHQETERYNNGGTFFSVVILRKHGSMATVSHTAPPESERSRSVTVPNVGGSIGISMRYSDAKFSLGYRADMFFGAIDGGIDIRKNENRGFYGPYASISIGLGD